MKTKRKMSYKVYLAFAFLILSIVLFSMLFTHIVRIKQSEAVLAGLKIEESNLKKEKSSLSKEVKNLENSDYVVRYARDNYIFSKDGEKAVVLPGGE